MIYLDPSICVIIIIYGLVIGNFMNKLLKLTLLSSVMMTSVMATQQLPHEGRLANNHLNNLPVKKRAVEPDPELQRQMAEWQEHMYQEMRNGIDPERIDQEILKLQEKMPKLQEQIDREMRKEIDPKLQEQIDREMRKLQEKMPECQKYMDREMRREMAKWQEQKDRKSLGDKEFERRAAIAQEEMNRRVAKAQEAMDRRIQERQNLKVLVDAINSDRLSKLKKELDE